MRAGPRLHRLFVLPAAAAVALSHGLSRPAAQQEPQRPVFRSGVELITVDVSVVDKAGRPIRGLGSDQFEVAIDGRPRRVVSAELVDHAPTAAAGVKGPATSVPRPAYSSNDAPGAPVAPGRLIYVLVDQGSFPPAGARGATDAARRFVQRLQPQDRVGLLAFPPPGAAVAASKNHGAVLDGLKSIVGSAEPLVSRTASHATSLAEAIDIEAGDSFALDRVVARECQGLGGGALTACIQDIQVEARNTSQRAEFQARQTLGNLESIVASLARIPERKTVVLIGGGLPTADRFSGGLQLSGEVSVIARAAAAANASIYVLHADSSFLDAYSAAERRFSDTLARDSAMLAAGLENIAGASGGTLFRVETGADFAFDRVLLETSATYVLGVEPVEGDRNGKPHTIKVTVRAPGAQVRNRSQFALAPSPAADETSDSQLQAALRAPRLATALPLAVTTRTVGRAPLGSVRVLVAANIGRNLAGPLAVQVGCIITNAAGDITGSTLEKQNLTVSPGNTAGAASFVASISLKPGDYTLRLAAVDAAGRLGSVDHPFTVGLADGEGIAMGDLLLFVPPAATPTALSPVVDGRLRGTTLDAHLEFYARGRSAAPPAVTFGLAERPDGEPLVQLRATASKPDAEGHSTADARLDLGLVPPGDYVVVATISDGKRRLGRRHEALRVEAAAPPADAASAPLPRVRFEVGESKFVKAFTRRDVLGPDALAYFLGRLQAADKGPASAPVAAAAAALRAGQFDGALSSLAGAQPDRLSVPFLAGLALLGKGDLEPAAKQFRQAVEIADDFLPAAFYLGACYAAGGQDEHAVGAWQTALVTETDARIVYDVLADALLRLDEAGEAIAILTEARGRWPDDAGFPPRLAAAQAMAQRRGEALDTLEAYLAGHESDAEAAALAIRLIYEAHAAGRTARSEAADREMAAKYGALYRAAGGSNQALIDRWVAFIAKS